MLILASQQAIAPLIIAGLIAGGAALAGTTANAISQAKANKTNKQIAEYQNAWNLSQWERENAYNTPSAMMARYKAAGLNPNVVYNQSNTAASSPRSAAYTHQAIDYGLDEPVQQALNVYMQAQQLQMAKEQNAADVALRRAQAQAVQQDILVKAQREVQLSLSNELNKSTMPYQVQTAQEQLRRLQAGNVLLGQQQVLNNQKFDINERRMAIQEQLAAIQWDRLALENEKVRLSRDEYNLRSWQLDNMERRARKEFNMNFQDWKAMRVGKIGNQYLQWANPLVQGISAYMRFKK